MPLYESTFIARQDLSKQDVTRITDNCTAIISEQGGTVVKSEYWGLRSLAYRIQKNRKGHYTMMSIDAPAAAVKEMERTMRINEEIVRLLTIKVDEISDEPSAMMGRGRDDNYSDRDDASEGDAAATV